MGGREAMMIAGIGCRRDCPGEDIVALVRQAEATCGGTAAALAAPAVKAHEPGLHAAAATLGVPLLLVEADRLAAAQPRCVTRSPCAERALGVASVAEGCALAAAGMQGRLRVARIGSARATCALAEAPGLTLPALRAGPLPLQQAGEGQKAVPLLALSNLLERGGPIAERWEGEAP
jgi:cobalt-precorrin 5A hydrolase